MQICMSKQKRGREFKQYAKKMSGDNMTFQSSQEDWMNYLRLSVLLRLVTLSKIGFMI